MYTGISLDRSGIQITVEFPKWVEKLNDMVFLQEEDDDE